MCVQGRVSSSGGGREASPSNGSKRENGKEREREKKKKREIERGSEGGERVNYFFALWY